MANIYRYIECGALGHAHHHGEEQNDGDQRQNHAVFPQMPAQMCADAFACAHASGQDLRQALLKLYQDNASTLTPDPLYVAFYHSHPPASQRLARLTA